VPEGDYRAGLEILASRYRIVHADDPAEDRATELPYLAGSDERRLGSFNQALQDSQVDAIFCARGGYGCMRLLDLLDADALSQRNLPIVGFSDITALHAWAACVGVGSVHGPVVTQLPRLPGEQREALFALLEHHIALPLTGLTPICPGRAAGPLFAGNLSLLAHLCGTPYFPPLDGAILLLEEVDEAPYRIDRMLTQLLLAGELSSIAGIVIGELVRCDAARDVLVERLRPLGVPIASGAPVGHGRRNLALPQGATALLDTGERQLTFPELARPWALPREATPAQTVRR
jgi:muramoyltetrapeptide carboxypeptidase